LFSLFLTIWPVSTSSLKNSPNSFTPKRHWRMLFMKHVLPKLERPTQAFLSNSFCDDALLVAVPLVLSELLLRAAEVREEYTSLVFGKFP